MIQVTLAALAIVGAASAALANPHSGSDAKTYFEQQSLYGS